MTPEQEALMREADERVGYRFDTAGGPSAEEIIVSLARELRAALADAERFKGAIDEHNADCKSSCGRENAYTMQSRGCDSFLDRGRQCTDCPHDWLVMPLTRDEWAARAESKPE